MDRVSLCSNFKSARRGLLIGQRNEDATIFLPKQSAALYIWMENQRPQKSNKFQSALDNQPVAKCDRAFVS